MKYRMTIEHLKCRADLNFEVYFRVNSAIYAIPIQWDLMLFICYRSFLPITFFRYDHCIYNDPALYPVIFTNNTAIDKSQ